MGVWSRRGGAPDVTGRKLLQKWNGPSRTKHVTAEASRSAVASGACGSRDTGLRDGVICDAGLFGLRALDALTPPGATRHPVGDALLPAPGRAFTSWQVRFRSGRYNFRSPLGPAVGGGSDAGLCACAEASQKGAGPRPREREGGKQRELQLVEPRGPLKPLQAFLSRDCGWCLGIEPLTLVIRADRSQQSESRGKEVSGSSRVQGPQVSI